MFATFPASPALPSPGFWAREGFGGGLILAGFTPSRPQELEPAEVRTERRCGIGRLLRYIAPADIAGAP